MHFIKMNDIDSTRCISSQNIEAPEVLFNDELTELVSKGKAETTDENGNAAEDESVLMESENMKIDSKTQTSTTLDEAMLLDEMAIELLSKVAVDGNAAKLKRKEVKKKMPIQYVLNALNHSKSMS